MCDIENTSAVECMSSMGYIVLTTPNCATVGCFIRIKVAEMLADSDAQ